MLRLIGLVDWTGGLTLKSFLHTAMRPISVYICVETVVWCNSNRAVYQIVNLSYSPGNVTDVRMSMLDHNTLGTQAY